jgi:hypothetical protein
MSRKEDAKKFIWNNKTHTVKTAIFNLGSMNNPWWTQNDKNEKKVNTHNNTKYSFTMFILF